MRMFLKSPERVLGLFTVYFMALLLQSLIERELRNALDQAAANAPGDTGDTGEDQRAIEIYPEGRRTRRPTTRRAIDVLEPLCRYEIHRTGEEEPQQLFDSLDKKQQRRLNLLGIEPKTYGR